jgi:tetratricopeptide (TPR) repeat protein/serine/threonine protein kinase
MPSVFTCPSGHQWDAKDRGVCPVCGESGRASTVESVKGEKTGPYVAGSVPDPSATGPHDPQMVRDTLAELPAVPGYEIIGLLGKGGMGAVYRGRDPKFNRVLAVKVLREDRRQHPDSVARFLEEASITGQLQNPGIPPVHDIGTLPDGRPFLTIKLVQGQTFADLLTGRKSPAGDLPRYLAIFGQICKTIAYAHSRGVIHRDLKPQNVMVGEFGEVQVMDWGLAKVLPRPGRNDIRQIDSTKVQVTPTEHAREETQLGAMVGTPAYMPPEQARGQIDQVDERADVFGLGAILCVLLTGAPPYSSKLGDVFQLVQKGDVSDALSRLASCGADAEVVDLARRCLAPDPKDRPRDAKAVSDVMTAYEASVLERLRKAELQRAAAEVKAVEERRRRFVQLGLAGTALALVLAIGGGLWAWQQRGVVRKQNHDNAEASLARLPEMYKQYQWEEAKALVERTEALVGPDGDADLRERIGKAKKKTRLFDGLDEARLVKATMVEGEFNYAAAATQYAKAFTDYGLDLASEAPDELARRIAAEDPDVRDSLLVALDDWAWSSRGEGKATGKELFDLARAADTDPWRTRFFPAVFSADRAALLALGVEARQLQIPAVRLELLATSLRSYGERDAAIALLRWARDKHPDDYWLHLELGNVLFVSKSPMPTELELEEAVGCYRAAVALRPRISPAHLNLGHALHDKQQLDDAIAEFKMVIALDPKSAPAHSNLGSVLYAKRQLDDAIAEYNMAIKLDPKPAMVHINLGNVLADKQQLDDAITEYKMAIELDRKSAPAHLGLGSALRDKQQLDGAIAEYKKAIELDPMYAKARIGLGNALRDKHQLDDAIAEFKKAIELDPKDAPVHSNLGVVLIDKQQFDDAIAEFKKAIKLDPKDAPAHNGLGLALRYKHELDDPIAEYKTAIALDPKYAPAHSNLGVAFRDKHQLDDAIAEYKTAIALVPKSVEAHNNLGLALLDKHQLDDAIAEFKKAIGLDPNSAPVYVNLGGAFSGKQQLDDAIAAYKKAIELDPKVANAHGALGLALLQKGRFAEAQESTAAALKLLPEKHPLRPFLQRQLEICDRWLALETKLPELLSGKAQAADQGERLALLKICQLQQRNAAGAKLAADFFAADPKLADDVKAGHRYNAACFAALAAAGKGIDADKLDDKERTRLRRQAQDWLRADVAYWTKQATSAKPADRALVQQTLNHWQEDTDLAGIRDKDALAKLPAEERDDWQKLWAEVAEVLAKAGEKRFQ